MYISEWSLRLFQEMGILFHSKNCNNTYYLMLFLFKKMSIVSHSLEKLSFYFYKATLVLGKSREIEPSPLTVIEALRP